MVDVAVEYSVAISRDIEAISLSEPVIKRARRGAIRRRNRSVERAELCGRGPVMDASALVADGVPLYLY
jgi:hypothetical protein